MFGKSIVSLLLSALFAGLIFVETVFAASPEFVMDSETAPGSVKEINSPLGYGFLRDYRPTFLFDWIREKFRKRMEDLPPFFRDTRITAKVRNYYFSRNNNPFDNFETWAIGGGVQYRSGWAFDRFRLGSTLYIPRKNYMGPRIRREACCLNRYRKVLRCQGKPSSILSFLETPFFAATARPLTTPISTGRTAAWFPTRLKRML